LSNAQRSTDGGCLLQGERALTIAAPACFNPNALQMRCFSAPIQWHICMNACTHAHSAAASCRKETIMARMSRSLHGLLVLALLFIATVAAMAQGIKGRPDTHRDKVWNLSKHQAMAARQKHHLNIR
jgi:hypothetical protein